MFLPSLRATGMTGTEVVLPDKGKMAPEADFLAAHVGNLDFDEWAVLRETART